METSLPYPELKLAQQVLAYFSFGRIDLEELVSYSMGVS